VIALQSLRRSVSPGEGFPADNDDDMGPLPPLVGATRDRRP